MSRRTFPTPTSVALLSLLAVPTAAPAPAAHVVHLRARKFEYSPSQIVVKKGESVVIEIASMDRKHGFSIPELGLRSDVRPGATATLRFTADRAGAFRFHCDVFCGSGHEGMEGTLVVTEA